MAASPAAAHLGKISYSNLAVDGTEIVYRLKFAAHLVPGIEATRSGVVARSTVERATGDIEHWLERGIRIHSRGLRCEGTIDTVIGPDRNDDLQVILVYLCPQAVTSLRVQFTAFLDANVEGFENIVAVTMGGKSWSYVFGPANDLLIIGEEPRIASLPNPGGPTSLDSETSDLAAHPATSSPSISPESANADARATGSEATTAWETIRVFLTLGIEHILEGYDHLLFLMALLAVGGGLARLVKIVTAFTIAHSITLGLSTLGWISLPSGPVEIVIAASIAYVALENLLLANQPLARTDHRPAITFAFGLIHGFGFAGVLRETGLPASGILLPLLGFNVGVELGQLLVVIAAVPLLRIAGRGGRERTVTVVVSLAALVAAVYWIFERAL